MGVGRGAVVGRRPPAPAAATARFLCAGERIKDIVKVVPLRVLERGRKEGRKEGGASGHEIALANTAASGRALVELELFFPRGSFFPSLPSRFGHPRRQKR